MPDMDISLKYKALRKFGDIGSFFYGNPPALVG